MRSRTVERRPATASDVARLVRIVELFRGRRVVVLGDLVADEFVYGDIARISREAPVPILQHRKTELLPGGAGNAVANLRALGAVPLPVGLVGRDEAGRRLLDELRRRGVATTFVLSRAGYSTPTKSRILAGGAHTRRQQIVRVDRGGAGGELSPALAERLQRRLRRALDGAAGLLVADYGYGAAVPEAVRPLLGRLRRRAIPLFVDSRARVARYVRATACTPNQEELERALGLAPLESDAALHAAGRRLLRSTGNRAVLVTRGARGMCLFEPGRAPLDIPAFGADEVADVTGAGDTVIAVFTLALLAGASFADAARLSNCAAGLVVMKMGTATLTRRELVGALREQASGS